MKTIHINTERSWRGGEQQAIFLAAGLHRRGVGVVAVGQPESPFVARARREGLDVAEIRMRGEADPVAVARLRSLVRSERPDIVHMHTSHAHTLGVLACRTAGLGKTVVSRRVGFSIHRSPLKLNILKYRFGVDRYIAISEGVREVMVEDGIPRSRIEIVPSGVDLAELREVPDRDYREEFGIPSGAPVVGDVAAFGREKGQDVLVRACPRIWEREPRARVILVGDGEHLALVKEVAEEVGAGERLLFTGHRKDARALIRWFDVFVMCSLQEGLCTSILDAHALGTPVVASRVGGIPEAVGGGDAGLLVPPRDPESLADAILSVILDPEIGQRLNAAGRAALEDRFSVDAMVEGTLSVYERILADRSFR